MEPHQPCQRVKRKRERRHSIWRSIRPNLSRLTFFAVRRYSRGASVPKMNRGKRAEATRVPTRHRSGDGACRIRNVGLLSRRRRSINGVRRQSENGCTAFQEQAEALPIRYAQPHPMYTPTHWWPRDIDPRSRNDMIGGLGPDVTAAQTPGCPTASATPISSVMIGPPSSSANTTSVEATGGVATTWSDAADAGGCQGPTIPAGTSVKIQCKVSGLSMVDGIQSWYRIASAPWNSGYYASADAFYNNGQTSGALSSSAPFDDSKVPQCT